MDRPEVKAAKEITEQVIAFLDHPAEEIRNNLKRKRLTFENYSLLLDSVETVGDVGTFQKMLINSLRKVITFLSVGTHVQKATDMVKEKVQASAYAGATQGVVDFIMSMLDKLIPTIVFCIIILGIVLSSKLALSYTFYTLWIVIIGGMCFAISKSFFVKYLFLLPWVSLILTCLTYMKRKGLPLEEAITLMIRRLKEHKTTLIILVGFTITSITSYILVKSKAYTTFLNHLEKGLHESLKGEIHGRTKEKK
jgi:hypothetical protein